MDWSLRNIRCSGKHRVDLLFGVQELKAIHSTLPPFKVANPSVAADLFGSERVWSVAAASYLSLFTAPFPFNYRVLVVASAGHWTVTSFGLKEGIEEVIFLYRAAVERWLSLAAQALAGGGRPDREVIVRAYAPGHSNCHAATEVLEEPIALEEQIYNWNRIPEMNDSELCLSVFCHSRCTLD